MRRLNRALADVHEEGTVMRKGLAAVLVAATIVMGIALGYAADDRLNAFASDRLPLSEILTVKS